ncbi:MAG: hypothetical protein KJ548_03260, partial [Actinobacteria bacterium]|nr:hypothetical protein [Actinomycetota bacterium]
AQVAEVGAQSRRGAPALRRALALADARSESPWETVLRALHVVGGLPVVPQHEIRDRDGRFVARADLWIRGTTTIHEYDGAVHRDPAQQVRDLRRDRALLAAGWARRGYAAADLVRQPASVLRDAETTLGRRHRSAPVTRWQRMLTESSLTEPGRRALAARLSAAARP